MIAKDLRKGPMFQAKIKNIPNLSPIKQKLTSQLFYLDNLSVVYDGLIALKSIQLSIERGEVLFVTGASGAGKSTLLRVLAGDICKFSGKKMDPCLLGHGDLFISQVFQDLKLIDRLSIIDNLLVCYDSSVYKNKKEFLGDLNELAKVLGIQSRLNIKVRDANGGLKQKVAIIRALLSKPDVLIADEPTNSLDFENAQKIFDLLNLYSIKRGMTVIWASHNSELVKRFTGRIVHLDKGRLVYSGHACFI